MARIYNLSLDSPDDPAHTLTSQTVWNAFWLHALLKHQHRRGETLSITHSGNHRDRFTAALDARNAFMVGTGQPLWAHACDDCEKLIPAPSEDSVDSPNTLSKFNIIIRQSQMMLKL